MVLEQVVTIIFVAGVGAALIAYAARPRHRGASITVGPPAGGSFASAEIAQTAPMPQARAIETPSPVAQTLTEVAPVVANSSAEATVEAAPVASDMADLASPRPSSIAETVESRPRKAAGTRRAQKKRNTATKGRAKSTRTIKKS